jgi:DNA-binding HxlR family transcriptional regulator
MSSSASPVAQPAEVLLEKPGKWSLVVVLSLREEKRRFNELRRIIGGISQKILTTTLRDLERDGYVTRTLFGTIPPRVEYELTALGEELLLLAEAWEHFMLDHRREVEAARRRFDTAGELGPVRLVSRT